MGFFKKGHIIVLLINIAVASIVLFVIGYIVLNRLEKYTNHGYYITVPELRGLTPDEAKPFAKEKNLQILVIDSIYDNNAKPGTIVEQFPSPNAHVKNNRAIQLTINANAPEKIIFPNLRNVAFRQSLQRLKNLGLNVGRIEYIPSNFKNLVLDFKYEGNIIEPKRRNSGYCTREREHVQRPSSHPIISGENTGRGKSHTIAGILKRG